MSPPADITRGCLSWPGKRPPCRRSREDELLSERIRHYHRICGGSYGAPRILEDLQEEGIRVGQKRVARLMRAAGLQGVSRRKSVRTTVRKPGAQRAPDLMNRDFTADRPNRLCVADITYIHTWAGFLYLAVVLDAFSRRIAGWSMANHLRAELVIDALQMAVEQRRPEGVIHTTRITAANTPLLPSGSAVGKPVCGPPWDRLGIATTMRSVRVSSPRRNASYWTAALFGHEKKREGPYFSLSRVGTIRVADIHRSVKHRP